MAYEVNLNIDEIVDKLLPEALLTGLERAGQLVENEAKKNCPVDDDTLRASITHVVDADNLSVSIGTNVEAGIYVHEGTGIFNPEGRQTPWTYQSADGTFYTTKGQKPNPFLQSAVDENMDVIVQQFENLLGE